METVHTVKVEPPTPARQDTSMCQYLCSLMELSGEPIGISSLEDSYTVASEPHSKPEPAGEAIRQRYAEIVRWGAVAEGGKRRKTSPPDCHTCSSALSRPWACLTCSYYGCLPFHASSSSKGTNNCMVEHWKRSDGKCGFAVDPVSGTIFCHACSDAVYPDTFETLFRTIRIRVEEEHDTSREQSSRGKGRGRSAWRGCEVPETDGANRPCRGESRNLLHANTLGLRPLLNLSQTCFLSAILQSLIQNPLLKAYFLSDKHNRHVCANGSHGLAVGKPYLGLENGSGVNGEREKGCMCCEMDRAFEEFHNDDKSPFGPVTMLYSMWHASAELEGHGQQDAHSFFLAALDQIHAHAKGQLSSCNCIAHQTFAGSLLSAVTCSSCHTTSTTIDPILDVQLDFPKHAPGNGTLTLAGMLRRYCAEERVGELGKGYECSNCGGGPGVVATRKLQIKKLAPVLSFQLKRFAHNATSTKVELPIRFPSKLDMRSYVEGADESSLPTSLFTYDLFAVVTHEGKLDNGHYWADVLSGDEWWHCDDDKVTPTTLSAVLAQKAYMLFYVKRSLAFAPPPSHFLASTSNGISSGSSGLPHATGIPIPGVASQTPGGKSGHPIRGMAV